MSIKPKQLLTAQQYLQLDSKAEYRSEFVKGRMFPMPGGTITHNRIKENTAAEIWTQIKLTTCQSFSSDMRLQIVAEEIYTYPDIVVVCGPVELQEDRKDVILNPRLIVEVLSPSTQKYDRKAKFEHYMKIPSFVEYLIVSQDEPRVQRFCRRDNGDWQIMHYHEMNEVIEFGSIPVKLALSDIYFRVEFEPVDDAEESA